MDICIKVSFESLEMMQAWFQVEKYKDIIYGLFITNMPVITVYKHAFWHYAPTAETKNALPFAKIRKVQMCPYLFLYKKTFIHPHPFIEACAKKRIYTVNDSARTLGD